MQWHQHFAGKLRVRQLVCRDIPSGGILQVRAPRGRQAHSPKALIKAGSRRGYLASGWGSGHHIGQFERAGSVSFANVGIAANRLGCMSSASDVTDAGIAKVFTAIPALLDGAPELIA